ncbi:MAG: hypothetical protein JNJ47_01735 [Alphaproteobacteria bacterium]|nr:hypothetical protein [Alphaproteobacteria bacterium]
MLKIIEPQTHELHSERINSLLGLLKIYQNFYIDPEAQDRATFVIAEDDKRGVYGGAVLYPHPVSSFFEFSSEETDESILDKMFSSLHLKGVHLKDVQPKVKEYWTARICLCLGYDRTTPLRETAELYRCFYHKLYKAFCYFREKENLEYLSFTLRASDTHVNNNLRLLTYQTWPSLLDVKHSDNGFHTYLHGILSFKEGALKENTLKAIPSKANTCKVNTFKVDPFKASTVRDDLKPDPSPQRGNPYPYHLLSSRTESSSNERRLS